MLAWVLAAVLLGSNAEAVGPSDGAGWVTAERLVAAKAKVKGKVKGKAKRGKAKPAEAAEPADAEPQAPAAPPAPPEPPPLPAPRPLPTTYRAVAVLPLGGIDVGFDLVHEVEIALLREVDETQGMRSITPGDVRADASAVGLDPDRCQGDTACLAQAARYARAHLALETRLAALGGTLSVSMRLVDTEAQKELGRVAEPLSDDPAQRATELHRYAVQLFAPDTYVGSLRIKCSQDGADVYLDDKLVGGTPMAEPLKALRAGPHILRVTKTGFSDLYQFVDVVYNRSSTVELDLSTTALVGVLVEAESQTGVGSLYVDAPEAGIEVRADGEPKGTTPLPGPIAGIPAGKRRISLRKEGLEPLVREVSVEAGKRTDIVVERDGAGFDVAKVDVVDQSARLPNGAIVAAPVVAGVGALGASMPVGAFESRWRTYGGIGAAGAGVVLLAVGGYGAWRVHRLDAQTKDVVAHLEPLGGGVYSCADLTRDECASRANRLHDLAGSASTARTLQAVGLVGGGVLALGGGALWVWDLLRRPAGAPAPSRPGVLTLVPAPGGAAVSVAGSF